MNWTEEQLKAIEAAMKKVLVEDGANVKGSLIAELTKPEVTFSEGEWVMQKLRPGVWAHSDDLWMAGGESIAQPLENMSQPMRDLYRFTKEGICGDDPWSLEDLTEVLKAFERHHGIGDDNE